MSISDRYQPLSRELMMSFLQAAHRAPELERLVQPRTPIAPPRYRHWDHRLASALCGNLDDLGALVNDLEPDRKGLPILLRHYLKLNARAVAFNRDPRFSHVWDCLLVVNLRQTPDALLVRYLGRDGLSAYRAHHAVPRDTGTFSIA